MEVRDDLAPAAPHHGSLFTGRRHWKTLSSPRRPETPTPTPSPPRRRRHDDGPRPYRKPRRHRPGLPRSIQQTLEGADGGAWYVALHEQILAFEANKTWRPMRKKDVPLGTPSFSLGTTFSNKRAAAAARKSASTSTASV